MKKTFLFLNRTAYWKISKQNCVDIIMSLFVLLFLYASCSKLWDYQKFKVQIAESPLLTDFAPVLAWMVPSIEILISVLLLVPRTLMYGLYASLSLMVVFTAYIYAILNFSNQIPCSCGGVLESMNWNQHLLFNVGFVLLAIVGIYLNNKSQT